MVDAIQFAFDILSFISVMVLVVLGLGIIASMMGIFRPYRSQNRCARSITV